jgi:hypothetical protein
MEARHVTCWEHLPYDLVERILANFSVHELAQVCPACSTIRAVCRRRIAQEHKRRCELAETVLGRELLLYLALIIDRYLRGEPLEVEADAEDNRAKWLLVEETRVVDRILRSTRSQRVYQAGNLFVEVSVSTLGNRLLFRVPTLGGLLLRIEIRACRAEQFSLSVVDIGNGEAFGLAEGMAFLQVLLGGVLAPVLMEIGLPSHVRIVKYVFANRLTQEELQGTHFASLVPGPPHTTFAVLGVGRAGAKRENMQVRQVGWWMPLGLPLHMQPRKEHLHLTLCVELPAPPLQETAGLFHTIMQYLVKLM